MTDVDISKALRNPADDCGSHFENEEFIPIRDNPQRDLAVSLINTLGFKQAVRFARERQWKGVIIQLYRGLNSGPA